VVALLGNNARIPRDRRKLEGFLRFRLNLSRKHAAFYSRKAAVAARVIYRFHDIGVSIDIHTKAARRRYLNIFKDLLQRGLEENSCKSFFIASFVPGNFPGFLVQNRTSFYRNSTVRERRLARLYNVQLPQSQRDKIIHKSTKKNRFLCDRKEHRLREKQPLSNALMEVAIQPSTSAFLNTVPTDPKLLDTFISYWNQKRCTRLGLGVYTRPESVPLPKRPLKKSKQGEKLVPSAQERPPSPQPVQVSTGQSDRETFERMLPPQRVKEAKRFASARLINRRGQTYRLTWDRFYSGVNNDDVARVFVFIRLNKFNGPSLCMYGITFSLKKCEYTENAYLAF